MQFAIHNGKFIPTNNTFEVEYMMFHPVGTVAPEPTIYTEYCFGSDIATVLCCTDINTVHQFMAMIDEDDMDYMTLQYDMEGIQVLHINGVYIVCCEMDMREQLAEWVEENFLVSGAETDDQSIVDVLHLWQHMQAHDATFYEVMDGYNRDVFDGDDELECACDAAQRIVEYSSLPNAEHMLMDIVGKLYPTLEKAIL